MAYRQYLVNNADTIIKNNQHSEKKVPGAIQDFVIYRVNTHTTANIKIGEIIIKSR